VRQATQHLDRARTLLVAALCVLVAGCSAGGSGSNAPPSAASSSASVSAAPVPVLGQSRAITQGYGSVRPSTINNGGDPTGIVTGVSWTSWGGAQATGTGMGYYDPPNVPVSSAVKEQATVVAFDLGTCDGRYMYQAIEWYFPESGGFFHSASYLNVCSWTYSPGNGS
jgi:hypothetical protein